jgi:hypothetical protein
MLIAFGIQSKRAVSELYKERDARRVSTNQRRGVCVYNKKKIRKLFGQKNALEIVRAVVQTARELK